MRAAIDAERCQGHGRCYELAPELFDEDDEGYGRVIGDGTIASPLEAKAWLAQANCPENAITVEAV